MAKTSRRAMSDGVDDRTLTIADGLRWIVDI